MTHPRQCRSDLTPTLKRALVILLQDGHLDRQHNRNEHTNNYWISRCARKCALVTILSLYDRYLVKIVVESRHRRRQRATLTDVGVFAAREIERQMLGPPLASSQIHPVSEDVALLISEIVE